MEKLVTLQRRFKRLACSKEGPTKETARWLKEGPPISLKTRVGIYQYAYAARILESLEEDFPRLQKRCGRSQFRKLITEFLQRHPSRHANLAEYSGEFPLFLRAEHPSRLEWEAIAWLDWLENLAWVEETAESNLAKLAEVPQSQLPRIRFHLSPSVAILECDAPLIQVRSNFKRRRRVTHLVFRGPAGVEVRLLHGRKRKIFAAIARGATTLEVFALAERLGIGEEKMARWFGEWSSELVIQSYSEVMS